MKVLKYILRSEPLQEIVRACWIYFAIAAALVAWQALLSAIT